MKKLGIAITGCGAISKNHGDAVLKSPNAELLYCMDIIEDRAVEFSKMFGGVPLNDYKKMLDDPAVDIVHICTPHHTHPELAIEAMEHGKHVLCEKPMAIYPDEAKNMIEAAEKNHRYLGICFQNRMNPTTVMAKKELESGKYGRIVSAMAKVAWDRHGAYYTESSWRGRYATEGGGVIINQAIHTIDLLDYLCGGISTVTAIAAKLRETDDYEVDDSCMANFGLLNGGSAVGHFTNCYTGGKLAQVEINCEKAKFVVDQKKLEIITDNGTEVYNGDQPTGAKSEWGASHNRIIHLFYDCILENKPFFVDGYSAIRSVLIVDALKRSNGHLVHIDA